MSENLIVEIEAELLRAKRELGMLDHFIKNLEIDLAETKVGLAKDDKAFIENMLEYDNPYHGGFGNFKDYWKIKQKDIDLHIDILADKFSLLAFMLREKYSIDKSELYDACV